VPRVARCCQFWLQVGSFATAEQATAFCDNLKAAGGQCILQRRDWGFAVGGKGGDAVAPGYGRQADRQPSTREAPRRGQAAGRRSGITRAWLAGRPSGEACPFHTAEHKAIIPSNEEPEAGCLRWQADEIAAAAGWDTIRTLPAST
jgi:hypothetical protein